MKCIYFESFELLELINYCRINAVKIVINHNKDKNNNSTHKGIDSVYTM